MSLTIFDDFRKEFQVTDDGVALCSMRAIARMTGKDITTIRNLIQKVSDGKTPHKIFEPFAGQDCSTDGKYIDSFVSVVIQYYAFKGSETAFKYASAFLANGLRNVIREVIHWQKPQKKYGNLFLSAPRVWTKIFEDDFYDELSRLTGLSWDKNTHRKPCIFAKLTYELVYYHLPKAIYQQIKANQQKHGGYIHKVHQYLSQEGIDHLINHLDLTLNILGAVSSIDDAKRLVNQSITRTYQTNLFG